MRIIVAFMGLIGLLGVSSCVRGSAVVAEAARPAASPEPALAARPSAPAPGEASRDEPVEIRGYTAEVAAALARRHAWYHAGESRIALVRRGAVRLEPEGADLGVGDLATFDAARRLMVIEDGARPRVIADDAGVRLLLYVDRADARPILVAAAPLRSRPGASIGDPPRRGHVIVQPGAWVDVEARKHGAVKIRYRDEDVDFHGWVPADALGTTFTRHERPPPDPDTVWIARRRTTLTATPGGERLARVEEGDAVVTRHGGAVEGDLLVEYQGPCTDDYSFVGFVPRRDLFQPNYGSVHGCGHGGGEPLALRWGDAESAPRVHVDAGRFLLDADAPVLVGCVLRETELAELADGRFAAPTIWGPIFVRLAPEGSGGACGTES